MTSESRSHQYPWSSLLFSGLAGGSTYVGAATLFFLLFYWAQVPDWSNVAGFRLLFSLTFLSIVFLTFISALLVARKMGASVSATMMLTLVIIFVLALPTLWILGYYNNCLGLPGPLPFGGSGRGCG